MLRRIVIQDVRVALFEMLSWGHVIVMISLYHNVNILYSSPTVPLILLPFPLVLLPGARATFPLHANIAEPLRRLIEPSPSNSLLAAVPLSRMRENPQSRGGASPPASPSSSVRVSTLMSSTSSPSPASFACPRPIHHHKSSTARFLYPT